jgi:hypothetical protein
VVEVTKIDKGIPALGNVHFTKEGATIGSNGAAALAVSPVSENMRDSAPLDSSEMFGDETIPIETVKEILKNMPRDATFRGVLEHCDLQAGKFTLTDGKRKRTITGKQYPRDYVDYQGLFARVGKERTEVRVAVNLKRLLAVLTTVNKICGDISGTVPVYLEFSVENDVIIRCENAATEQRVCAIMQSYKGTESRWLTFSEWENRLFGFVKKAIRKLKREPADLSLRSLNQKIKKQGEERFTKGVERLRKNFHEKARPA